MKLLIVEDEPALAAGLVSYLRPQYVCEAAATFGEAQEKMLLYDCILLDLTLPGGGLDLLCSAQEMHRPAGPAPAGLQPAGLGRAGPPRHRPHRRKLPHARARREMQRLLGPETLPLITTWPDEIRPDPQYDAELVAPEIIQYQGGI